LANAGVEAPVACAFAYYLFSSTFANEVCPDTEVGRLTWVGERLFLAVMPSWIYIWGALRSFDSSTKCEDPFAGVETARWKKSQKILTNNTEQVCLFLPAILSLALQVPASMWPLIPAFFYTFVLGRFLFGAGYFVPTLPKDNPLAPFGTLNGWARSPGMNLTLYPTTFALMFNLYYYYMDSGEGSVSGEL
jgi:hypothetical protein